MPGTTVDAIAPDAVVSFEIRPGSLAPFLGSRMEKGPRLKCVEGSVSLVSPGRPHESASLRLHHLILAVCLELDIELVGLESTTWSLPPGAGDTAYEADRAYHVQGLGADDEDRPPDLAIEVVVTHPEAKALRAGAAIGIPALWVLDLPRRRLTFYRRVARGKDRGTYRPARRSRAFPDLTPADVLERLDDPAGGDTAYFRNCRAWARRVLVRRGTNGDVTRRGLPVQ